jgi:hypothetical protein
MVLCRIAGFTGSDAVGLLSRGPATGAARSLGILLVAMVAGGAEPAQPAPDQPFQRDFKVLGRESSPVAIVEFTDMQCPGCGPFSRPTVPARYASNTSTRATCAACRGTCRSPSTGRRFRPRSRHAALANRAGAGSVWRRSRRVGRRRPATISRTGSGSISRPSTTAASPGCSSRRSAGTPPRRGSPGSARHRRSCRDGRPGAVSATLEGAEPLALFQPKINALRRQKQQPSPGACATPRRRDPRAPRPRAPSAARHASA